MNKLNNNKSGFTLIEIIVVLIIIGILAAIALPNLFSNVAKSQAASVLASIDGDKTPLEACLGINPATSVNSGNCTFALLNLPSTFSNGWKIVYGTSTGNAASGNVTYSLRAEDSANNIGATLTRATTGTWTCAGGSGAYSGVC